MKYPSLLVTLLISICGYGQNASAGLSVGSYILDSDVGTYVSANIRGQFSEKLGWQTEVGHGISSTTSTLTEEVLIDPFPVNQVAMLSTTTRDRFTSIKTGLSWKIAQVAGINIEAIAGPGLYKDSSNIYGLLSAELFLSAQIGKNLVAGLPISYNFVTWRRDEYYTAAASLRYHF